MRSFTGFARNSPQEDVLVFLLSKTQHRMMLWLCTEFYNRMIPFLGVPFNSLKIFPNLKEKAKQVSLFYEEDEDQLNDAPHPMLIECSLAGTGVS